MATKIGEIKIPRKKSVGSPVSYQPVHSPLPRQNQEEPTVTEKSEAPENLSSGTSRIQTPSQQQEEQRILDELEAIKHGQKSQYDQVPQVDNQLASHPETTLPPALERLGLEQSHPQNPPIKPQDVGSHSTLHKEILRVKSVFPFDFFPDELIIEEGRVVLKHRIGLFSRRLLSILIRDISQSQCSTSLFFGKITIQDIFGENEIVVDHLPKQKALLTKRVLDRLQSRERRRIQGVPAEGVDRIMREERARKRAPMIDTGW